jgi:O-phospho-L-seryl-tRNASec:L-selenocysteinyl-tRNA synthase
MFRPDSLRLIGEFVGRTYTDLGQEVPLTQAINTLAADFKQLLASRRLPPTGWSEQQIEFMLAEIAMLDSNNFSNRAGVGEREGRTVSRLVAKRHFYMTHGVGRSGDLVAVQPKAAGSSLIAKLTEALVKHAFEVAGLQLKHCVVMPCATGLSCTLVFLALKQQRPVR